MQEWSIFPRLCLNLPSDLLLAVLVSSIQPGRSQFATSAATGFVMNMAWLNSPALAAKHCATRSVGAQ